MPDLFSFPQEKVVELASSCTEQPFEEQGALSAHLFMSVCLLNVGVSSGAVSPMDCQEGMEVTLN